MASEPIAPSKSFAVFIPEFERLIAELTEEWKVPGIAVAGVQNEDVAFARPYGLRDVEASLKVTTNTQFQLMSITKSFTAAGFALLVDERRMDLKKPVREYLPEFRLHDAVACDRVTVRDLLCHHSGLPRHDWIWLPGDMSPAQMLAAMRHLKLNEDIRSTFQYSNLGYLVANMVAERISGQNWADFTRSRLTDKLNMDVTFTVEELAAVADAAIPYAMVGNTRVRSNLWSVSIIAASAISTSIASFANWLRFHLCKGEFEGGQRFGGWLERHHCRSLTRPSCSRYLKQLAFPLRPLCLPGRITAPLPWGLSPFPPGLFSCRRSLEATRV
jgi:CubicO group peptidase (beta-lactamase class C family)